MARSWCEFYQDTPTVVMLFAFQAKISLAPVINLVKPHNYSEFKIGHPHSNCPTFSKFNLREKYG